MKIAIIDDEKGILLTLRLYLETEGYTVLTFSSPLEALRVVPEENVDLIIIDQRMPEMNGEQVALFFRNNEKTKEVPLVLTSAYETLPEVAERVGTKNYLEKPFQFTKLHEIILKYEGLKNCP